MSNTQPAFIPLANPRREPSKHVMEKAETYSGWVVRVDDTTWVLDTDHGSIRGPIYSIRVQPDASFATCTCRAEVLCSHILAVAIAEQMKLIGELDGLDERLAAERQARIEATRPDDPFEGVNG